MESFCTIITSNYFFYVKAICDSFNSFDLKVKLQVLIVDDFEGDFSYDGVEVHVINDLKVSFKNDYNLIKHYEDDKASNLRWALKPLFLKYLLLEKRFEKVIFVDPDLYFYNSPLFLFDYLNNSDVIITPHWRSKDPIKDVSNFNSLFTGGLFNAGFFGCNSNSTNVLDWWLSVCAYKMKKKDGFYVDQAYLNLMPIYFPSQVKILEHKGCNVSNWNMIECKRTSAGDTVLINSEYPIVFIHYTNATINIIANGNDYLLKPFLKQYHDSLLKHNETFLFNKTMSLPQKKKSGFSLKLKIRNLFKI
ncbi:hypothetical protein [Thalassobellus sediminis]|uniref:hypothetical protein n=1 Tax=Thalassobellus sediminis TaxID=3367753 RepID=UPI0037A71453